MDDALLLTNAAQHNQALPSLARLSTACSDLKLADSLALSPQRRERTSVAPRTCTAFWGELQVLPQGDTMKEVARTVIAKSAAREGVLE